MKMEVVTNYRFDPDFAVYISTPNELFIRKSKVLNFYNNFIIYIYFSYSNFFPKISNFKIFSGE